MRSPKLLPAADPAIAKQMRPEQSFRKDLILEDPRFLDWLRYSQVTDEQTASEEEKDRGKVRDQSSLPSCDLACKHNGSTSPAIAAWRLWRWMH